MPRSECLKMATFEQDLTLIHMEAWFLLRDCEIYENRRLASLQIKSLGWFSHSWAGVFHHFFLFPPNLRGFVTVQKSFNRDWAFKVLSCVDFGGVILFTFKQGNYENQWGKIHSICGRTMDCFPNSVLSFFLKSRMGNFILPYAHLK